MNWPHSLLDSLFSQEDAHLENCLLDHRCSLPFEVTSRCNILSDWYPRVFGVL